MFKTLPCLSVIPLTVGVLGFGVASADAAIYFTDSNQYVSSNSFEAGSFLLLAALLVVLAALMAGAWFVQRRLFSGEENRDQSAECEQCESAGARESSPEPAASLPPKKENVCRTSRAGLKIPKLRESQS